MEGYLLSVWGINNRETQFSCIDLSSFKMELQLRISIF